MTSKDTEDCGEASRRGRNTSSFPLMKGGIGLKKRIIKNIYKK